MDQLIDLVDGDREKAGEIWNVSRLVIRYAQFKSVQKIGLNINYDALPFERVMMFSWIQEAIDVRKTRV